MTGVTCQACWCSTSWGKADERGKEGGRIVVEVEFLLELMA